jgi:hypothetical protein
MKTMEGLGELEPTCMNLAIFILFILFLFLATETSKIILFRNFLFYFSFWRVINRQEKENQKRL